MCRNHELSFTAKGGPYMCAHVRRKDYVFSRENQIPNLESAAAQLRLKCQEHNVDTVFIATDAPDSEFNQIKSFLHDIKVRNLFYNISKDMHNRLAQIIHPDK